MAPISGCSSPSCPNGLPCWQELVWDPKLGGLFSLFVDFSVFDEGYFSKYSVTLYRLCSVLDESVVIYSGRILFSGNKRTGKYHMTVEIVHVRLF